MGEFQTMPHEYDEIIQRLDECYDLYDVLEILDLPPKLVYSLLFTQIEDNLEKFEHIINRGYTYEDED